MAPNIPEMYEAHFGVPMTGGVLNCLNTRLDAAMIAFILDHSEVKVFIVDREYHNASPPRRWPSPRSSRWSSTSTIRSIPRACRSATRPTRSSSPPATPTIAWDYPADEWNAISLNYTSGTTGNPKGVVFHHRGATLVGLRQRHAMADRPASDLSLDPADVPLQRLVLPVDPGAGRRHSVCLRRVSAKTIFDALVDHDVTHMCGAPIIMQFIIGATAEERRPLTRKVEFMTAAAPPPAAVLEALEKENFRVTHVYGLTEVYGPATVCAWHEDWDALDSSERARLKARQGVRYAAEDGVTVMDPTTMKEVPRDGSTMGEVMFRGNLVMKGYLKNPKATQEAFEDGWFHSGDLGVLHEDGYIELRDRSKDIIISGGENISTIEVEGVIIKHPAVANVAVVAKPDEKWGETPCAFVVLKPGASATAEDIIAHCRANLASYKCPRYVVFRELPMTSTGKVQKFVLRDWARRV